MVVSNSFQSSTLPIGFTYLDLDDTTDIRIYCNTFNDNGTVKLNLSSWGNTILHSAQSNWQDLLAVDPTAFQWGSFSTQDVAAVPPVGQATRQVVFPTPFDAPPVVIVWINELEISSSLFVSLDLHSWRIDASASNVVADQFTLVINTWSTTYLYSAAASWIAYPSNSPIFASGTFSTFDLRPWQDVQLLNQRQVSFDKPFRGTPLVTAAINELDFGTASNLRISVNITDITSTGLTWHLDSWADSIFYSGSGSYLAWYSTTTTPTTQPTTQPTVNSTTRPMTHTSYATTIGVSVVCSVLVTLVLVFVAALIFRRRRRLRPQLAIPPSSLPPSADLCQSTEPWSLDDNISTPSTLVYNKPSHLIPNAPHLSPNTPPHPIQNTPSYIIPNTSSRLVPTTLSPLVSNTPSILQTPNLIPTPSSSHIPLPSFQAVTAGPQFKTYPNNSSDRTTTQRPIPMLPTQGYAAGNVLLDDGNLGMETASTIARIGQTQPPPYTFD